MGPDEVKKLRSQIESSGIYVGHGAEKANQSLVNAELEKMKKSTREHPSSSKYQVGSVGMDSGVVH